jgi:hypothetical protein
MDKMKVIIWMLIMITLAGLPAGVEAQGDDDDDDGVVASDLWRKRI